MIQQLTHDIMYNALVAKDASFEGTFFAAIRSTGIFCRPTCTARKPKTENVEFYKTTGEAIRNGYRPCKICKPLLPAETTPGEIEALINDINVQPYLRIKDYDLKKRGLEPHSVRRWFKKNHGLTFHAFQRMNRINYAMNTIKNGNEITHAAYSCGYESLSGFAEAYKAVFGTSPSQSKFKNTLYLNKISTPLGPMYCAATDEGIGLLEFTDRWMLETELKGLSKMFAASIVLGKNPQIETLESQLDEYFRGSRTSFDVNIITPGTEFQKKVWQLLCQIPYGKTVSYKQQAVRLDSIRSVRAVAKANGMNRIAIIIPCHRVIGSNGDLTGYAGGLWRKKWLLKHEAKFSNSAIQGILLF